MRSTKSLYSSLLNIKNLKLMRMPLQPMIFNLHNNSNNNFKVKTCLDQTTADKRALKEVRVSKKRYLMMKVTRLYSQAQVIMAVSITFVGVSSSVLIPYVKGHSTHAGCAMMRSITKTNLTQRRIIN